MKDAKLFVRLDEQMLTQVNELAVQRGESLSLIIREAIRSYLASRGKGGALVVPAVYPTSRGTDAAFNEISARKTQP